MDDPDLESVAVEAKVTFDPAQEPFDRGVGPNGAPAARSAAGPREPCFEAGLIRLLGETLEASPVRSLKPLQDLGLGHEPIPPLAGRSAGNLSFS
jgi:hypothetical protein